MIVRASNFDTIINLYKPRIPGNCIKIVSKMQFLTFSDGVKINKELSLCDLALYLSCLGRIRTLTKGARNLRATITPQGNLSCQNGSFQSLLALSFRFNAAKLGIIC